MINHLKTCKLIRNQGFKGTSLLSKSSVNELWEKLKTGALVVQIGKFLGV